MLEKFSQQQLDNKSLAELTKIKEDALTAKANLEKAKKAGKDWTEAMQDELDEVVGFIVDLDEYMQEREKLEKEATEANKEASYVVPKGTEKMVHLSIVRGRRYSSATGKEITKPHVQVFTFAEWQLFKKNFKGLGFTIVKALHDPYGDAAALVAKDEE